MLIYYKLRCQECSMEISKRHEKLRYINTNLKYKSIKSCWYISWINDNTWFLNVLQSYTFLHRRLITYVARFAARGITRGTCGNNWRVRSETSMDGWVFIKRIVEAHLSKIIRYKTLKSFRPTKSVRLRPYDFSGELAWRFNFIY